MALSDVDRSVGDGSRSGSGMVPVLEIDPDDLTIVTVSPSAAAVFGFETSDLIGAPLARLVVAPDEFVIREQLQAVAYPDGTPPPPLAATIIRANGSLGYAELVFDIEATGSRIPATTVLAAVIGAESGAGADTLHAPHTTTTAWLVREIHSGSLAESEIGVALFHTRTCRRVAANRAYERLAGAECRQGADETANRLEHSVDGDDLRSIHAVRGGRLGAYMSPQSGSEGAPVTRFLAYGLGSLGGPPIYFMSCVYPPGSLVPIRPPADALAVDHTTRSAHSMLACIVDERWNLRLVPSPVQPRSTAWEVGESALPFIHPRDLPALIQLGREVQCGRLDRASISLMTRGAHGGWTLIDAEITGLSHGAPSAWLALHSTTPAVELFSERGDVGAEHSDGGIEQEPGAGELRADWDRLLARTYPGLSTREREVAQALLDGYRVTTIARSLFLSPSTVRNHLSSIFHKTGVGSQAELLDQLHLLRHDRFPE